MYMRILIACSGNASRWKNYLNVPKHLIEIDGEKLLNRTVRLIKEKVRQHHEIFVVAHDNLYKIDGTTLIRPELTQLEKEQYCENPFICVSKKWWNDKGMTIILFGDVFFTKNAIDIIFNHLQQPHQYTFFGRADKSSFTLCPYGEIFGLSFSNNFIPKMSDTVDKLKILKDSGKIKRFITWEVYRYLQSIELDKHIVKNNFVQIDDFTEDFDFPIDYDRWIKQWTNQRKKYCE